MNKELGHRDRLQNNNDKQQSPNSTGRPKSNGQSSQQQRPSNSLNKWLFLLVGIMLIIWLYNYFNASINNTSSSQVELSYSQYYTQVEQKNVDNATFVGKDSITGNLKKPLPGQTQTSYHVYQLPNPDNELPQLLINNDVKVISQTPADNSIWLELLAGILPWALLLGLIFFFS